MISSTAKLEAPPAGWVFGNFDGHVGTRIYPAWQGALEGKRLVFRDIRMHVGNFFVHDPYRNRIEQRFETIEEVERYILQHGAVPKGGANVWD